MRTDIVDLYTSERSDLVSLAALVLGRRDQAEDVVQACFERYGATERDDVRDPVRYLRRMVVNECRRVGRRSAREEPRFRIPAGVAVDSRIVELADTIAALSPRRRMAIVLRYHCDLPVHEIASLMGTRPSTVSSLIHRALHDLRKALA